MFSRLSIISGYFWRSRRYTASAIDFKKNFEEIVGPQNVLVHDIEKYTQDWTKSYVGGSLVCLPRNSEEVSRVLSFCHKNSVCVVPQGGNTGLVGGAVGLPNGSELIMSMSRMSQIIDIDIHAGVVVCEAGCILEVLNNEVEAKGFRVPLDLGAKGSCMIGGNIATNAGGLRLLKYGSFHKNVLGLEVVLPDGTVLDMLRSLHKDNCGYPLKHLFIGSEGTLGVITKIALSLITKPISAHVIMAKVRSFLLVPEVLNLARKELGANLTAFEFMDSKSINAVRKAAPQITDRIQSSILPSQDTKHSAGISGEVVVLIESTGSDENFDGQRLDKFAELILESGKVVDAVLSQDSNQERILWQLRENVPISLMQLSRMSNDKTCGKLFKYDISVALTDTNEFLVRLEKELINEGFCVKSSDANTANGKYEFCELEICNFGHAGDQNLHLNILASINLERLQPKTVKEFIEEAQKTISHHVYKLTLEKKGSISAEHGIGQQKLQSMILARSSAEIELMRGIKKLIDPKNIMNPCKTVP